MSSINIFCNSVESPLRFCLSALDIFASKSFLCLGVISCFKGAFTYFVAKSIGLEYITVL